MIIADGFTALATLDSNQDGIINQHDTQFNSLQIWQDSNQDGISKTGELFTLASLNIAAINVAKTANSQILANGNQIADLGTFTKTDGTTGTAGAVTGNLADVNLAGDTFHKSFAKPLIAVQGRLNSASQNSDFIQDDNSIAANDAKWRVAV